ncbi:solute carrier family 15 member 4-like [Anneissia japonica]|uniref:solute carrier family 15 member 4-like n=1 Tax=Anneissia japonica TaxID=1529436 RepID=UPI001425A9BF|nr:solute carrier family 15 member 4-like [Anneissia japonica]
MQEGGYFIQTVNNISYNASRLNVLYQIPQYAFIGISEAVIRTSGSELAFTQAPDNMKGIVMGIYLLMSGLGSFLINVILTSITNYFTAGSEWVTAEINDGCFDCFFYVLTGVQLLNLLYLYMLTRNYSYKCAQSIKTFYQTVTFSNEVVATGLDTIENASGNEAQDEWEYVAFVRRKSFQRCKNPLYYHDQYGTDNLTNDT